MGSTYSSLQGVETFAGEERCDVRSAVTPMKAGTSNLGCLHPFRVRSALSGGPGVSLRSTPGYLLASLWLATGVWTFPVRFLPEGGLTNSPAVHCRVLGRGRTSPEGTAESFPQVSLLAVYPVLFQPRDEFLLESHFAVVRLRIHERPTVFGTVWY